VLVDTARMRECEGCGGQIASDRVVCPDCGTGAPTPATVSALPLEAATLGTSGAGAPWERFAPPIAAAGFAPAALRPSLGPAGMAPPGMASRPAVPQAGSEVPNPFTSGPRPSDRVVVRTSSLAGRRDRLERRTGTIIAVISSAAVIGSALIDWTASTTAWRIPARFVIDWHHAGRDQPRLGVVLVGLGLIGLVVSYATGRKVWRCVLGLLTLGVVVAFVLQANEMLTQQSILRNAKPSLLEALGIGPFVCGVAAIALIAGAMFEG